MLFASIGFAIFSPSVSAQSGAQPGRGPEANSGEVGQRQVRENSALPIDPKARINNRIQNRLQNRIRNRIDRNYDPTANATSPYARADQRVRKAGQDPSG